MVGYSVALRFRLDIDCDLVIAQAAEINAHGCSKDPVKAQNRVLADTAQMKPPFRKVEQMLATAVMPYRLL
eukprot:6172618-Pleurochrysis_carterae.AAC.3